MTTPQPDPSPTHVRLDAVQAEALLRECLDEVEEGNRRIPDQVGPYRILREIDRGGMGTVYLAEQETPKRPVALKVLWSVLHHEDAERRFQREINALAMLDHPSIARILSAGAFAFAGLQIPYFAMEYVADAKPITAYCRERSMDRRSRVEILLAVCEAIQHGHRRGVIHRDLKPENILVRREEEGDRPKIIDFGIAYLAHLDSALQTRLTASSAFIGTLRYISPEQCSGRQADADTRSDVYSLGVILYELVCDALPYALETASFTAALRIIEDSAPIAPRSVRSDIPRDLSSVMLKALRKRPDDRYQSVSEFAADLRRWLGGDPVEARPDSLLSSVLRHLLRRPALTAGALALAIMVLLGGAFLLTWWAAMHRVGNTLRSDEGRSLAIHAVDGREIARIDTRVDDGIVQSEIVPDDRGAWTTRSLLVAISHESGIPGAGALNLYREGEYREPTWSRSVTLADAPTDAARPHDPGTFYVREFLVADIFADRPGDEIVAIHKHSPGSLCVLRAYGLDGSVLWEAWHDGHLHGLHWAARDGLLCVAGVNSELDSHRTIALAIKPVRSIGDANTHPWLDTGSPRSAIVRPKWYAVLEPDEASREFTGGLHRMLPPRSAEESLLVRLELVRTRPPHEGVTFVFAVDGDEVRARRTPSDLFLASPAAHLADLLSWKRIAPASP